MIVEENSVEGEKRGIEWWDGVRLLCKLMSPNQIYEVSECPRFPLAIRLQDDDYSSLKLNSHEYMQCEVGEEE